MATPTQNPVAAQAVKTATSTTKRKVRTPAPVGETKAQRFIRLGSIRMSKALSSVRVIGNLASSNYDYTPDQVAKMQTAINNAVKETFAKFGQTSTTAKAPTFQF